jgi:hypothetical protein
LHEHLDWRIEHGMELMALSNAILHLEHEQHTRMSATVRR